MAYADVTIRYALYFAPDDATALAAFARRWFRGPPLLDPAVQDRITATARRYGFHATLKAPFYLAEGQSEESLRETLAAFAASRACPATAPLALRTLDGFLALAPTRPLPEVNALAQACVEHFEGFRAPLDEGDLARRRAPGLTARQEDNLLRWGYPYVAEDFRFHMTLTARLNDDDRAAVEAALAPLTAPLCREPLDLDAVSLFRQDEPEAPFTRIARYPLAGARSSAG